MKHAHLAFASRRPAAQALAAVVAMTVATASLGAPDRHLEHADRHDRGGAGEAERDAADGRVGIDGPDPHARRGRIGRRGHEHRLQVVAVQRALLQPGHQLQAAARRQQQPVRAGQLQQCPYAGYGAYYTIPDTSTRDLRTQFVAYENATIDIPTGSPDTAGPGLLLCLHGSRDPRLYLGAMPAVRHPGGDDPDPGRRNLDPLQRRDRHAGAANQLRDLVLVLSHPSGADQERGQLRLRADQRHASRRLHHGRAEGHADVGGDQSDPLPAARRLQRRPRRASGSPRCSRRKPKAPRRRARAWRGSAATTAAGTTASTTACRPPARTIRSSTPASRTSPS